MPVTGLAALQDASSGQQTSGSESEEHLDAVKHTKERGDGCTHGLLRGQDGEDFDADQSIYADKTMQREGQRAGFDRPKSGFSAVLPLPKPRRFTANLSRRYVVIMVSSSAIALFAALRFFLLLIGPISQAGGIPVTSPQGTASPSTAATSSSYWLANIKRQGIVAFGDSSFKIYRNVQDYGAKGDGSTDDTAAINSAITDGNRCGQGCDSSTVTPAIVYFPPGTYIVSKPIVQLYYTQFIGDAVTLPTLKAAANFVGMAVIDADPYTDTGANWYTNQNNFFRQVRNFVIDLTGLPATTGTGIHWQVAQATSLQNIRFEMIEGGDDNKQQGIFMDNGSGGFMTDLVFNGGHYGAFFGNQQFTTRNLTFNNVQTAIFMNWNWVWTLKSVIVSNCGIGIDMSNNQAVGSVIVQDSKFLDTPKGIVTAFSKNANMPAAGGTLVLDNVDFTRCAGAVVNPNGVTVLTGGSKIASWAQGHTYTSSADASAGNATCTSAAALSSANIQETLTAATKPASLLDSTGAFYQRSKPQYENVPASSFVSVKSAGAEGDGITDDTAAIQAIFDSASASQIIYFDHGAYLVTNTIRVPANIKITGEIWPLIMATGPRFSSQANPIPVFQVGTPGATGSVEMSDLMFETKGPCPGAIMIEWNLASSSQGSSGLWDCHVRIGGTAGTNLQSSTCTKNPSVPSTSFTNCYGAFLMLHITSRASVYLENTWFWVADHELDLADHAQINIYNGRGVLVESQGPVWMYGTASEHSQLYNYQFVNARDVYMGAIQTETPYMQSNPIATAAFPLNAKWHDPTFENCTTNACKKAWGLRVLASEDIHVYGAGLYSFFENYDQSCLASESCQENMVSIECSRNIHLWGLSTKASTNMVTVDGKGVVKQAEHRNNFCSTLALFRET